MGQRTVEATILCFFLATAWCCGRTPQPEQEKRRTEPARASAVNLSADQALREASLQGQIEVMAAAVEQGARIDAVDADGRTALMYASFNGRTEAIRWLLDRGTAVGVRDNVGRTALMFASSGPFAEAVQALLEFGADPNAADEFESWTALMFAAGEGQADVIETLLDHGANPSAVDKDGHTAADHAAANGHVMVQTVLREAMGETGAPQSEAD